MSIPTPRPVRTATIGPLEPDDPQSAIERIRGMGEHLPSRLGVGPRLLGTDVKPRQTVRLLSPRIAEEIASAAVQAEERLTEREQAAEQAGMALTALLGQLDAHVTDLGECCWGSPCWPFRCLRIRVGHAERLYAATLSALKAVGRR